MARLADYLDSLKAGSYSILEIGCGEGLLYDKLHKTTLTYYEGIDISFHKISNVQHKRIWGRANFIYIEPSVYAPNRKFDFIIISDSAIYSKYKKVILEMCAEALRPEGYIVLNTQKLFKDIIAYRIA